MARGGHNRKTTEQWVYEAQQVHQNRYTYEHVVYTGSKQKVKITCAAHGDFLQTPGHHLNGVGCPKCKADLIGNQKRWGTSTFVARAISKHGRTYSYTHTTYRNQTEKVVVTCLEHGDFQQLPQAHLRGHGCPICAARARANASQSRRTSFDAFVTQARSAHGNKYDYNENTFEGMGKKVSVVCPIHGEFIQGTHLHISGSGCPACSREALSTKMSFSEDEVAEKLRGLGAQLVPGSYTSVNSKASFACAKHGAYESRVGDVLYKDAGCPRCGVKVSKAEDEVAEFLRSLGHDVVQSSRKIIAPKEIDIYIPALRFGLEYNGLYFHSDAFAGARQKHLAKQLAAKTAGVRLVHLFEDEWALRRPAVEATLAALTGKSTKLGGARDYTVTRHAVKQQGVLDFLERTHLQGAPKGGTAYILGDINNPAAVMTFSKITSERGVRAGSGWELTRFCTAGSIPGAASKLFKAFLSDANPNRVISYSDNRWFDGAMYSVLGFAAKHVTAPNYSVVVKNKRVHKANFKKSNLLKLLGSSYDGSKTEQQLCHENGWYRVYDCGLTKWEWEPRITQATSN